MKNDGGSRHWWQRSLVAAAGLVVAGVVTAPAATADSTGTIHTWGSVNLRSAAGTANPIIDVIPAGASPNLICFEKSEDVNGVDVWWRASWNGRTGSFASYYDDSHYPSDDDIPVLYGIPSCAVHDDPGVQSTPQPVGGEAGGIDLQAYCDTLGWHAQVVLNAPKTPNDWGCLYQPLALPYVAGMTSFTGASSTPVPNIHGAYVDFQEACHEQYGSNTAGVLTDPNDVRSWRCMWIDVANIG